MAKTWIGLELAAIFGGLAWWFARSQSQSETLPAWQAAALFGAGFLGLFYLLVEGLIADRKPLEEVRADLRFGVHTRDSLRELVDRVQKRLDLAGRPVRVWMGRGKDINAFAQRMELLPGIGGWNGVQLNRAMVHLLDEPELECVVGHELGHVFPYAPIMSRCLLVHALLAGTASLVLAQLLHGFGVQVGAPLLALWLVRWIAFSTYTNQVRCVEFLCDDFGARAGGLLAAARGELKTGIEAEARSALLLRVLEAKRDDKTLPIADLIADYESALPFGSVDSEQARAELERNLRRRLEQRQGSSVVGFLDYVWRSDEGDDGALDDSIARMHAVARLRQIPVPVRQLLAQRGGFAKADVAALVEALESLPDRVLFRLPEEIDDSGSTHPNASRRILYLWRHRESLPECRA